MPRLLTTRIVVPVLASVWLCLPLCSGCRKGQPRVSLSDIAPLPEEPSPTRDAVGADAGVQPASDRGDLGHDEDAGSAAQKAAPVDPMDLFPSPAQPPELPLAFEPLYQCVERNLPSVAPPSLQRRLHVSLATQTARFDATRGLAVLQRATGRTPDRKEAAELVTTIADWDLRRAVVAAVALADDEVRQATLEALVRQTAADRPEQAIAIAEMIPARIAREDLLLRLVSRLARANPAAATALADRIIEPLLNDWATGLVAAATRPESLEQALESLKSLENPVVLDWALLALGRWLAEQDLEAARKVLPRIQRSLIRDELLDHLALATAEADPDGALSLALSIGEPAQQRRTLDALSRALLPGKPEMARFLMEKKRIPPLSAEARRAWLAQACREHPEAVAAMYRELLGGLTVEQRERDLVACCPGAPRVTRSEASRQDINNDRLTACYVCGGVLPDLLVAVRSIAETRLRDDALRCALERELPADKQVLLDALALFAEPLMRDQAVVGLVAGLAKAGRTAEALEAAQQAQDPYLLAGALLPLLDVSDEELAADAQAAYQQALGAVADPWRRDDVAAQRVRLLRKTNTAAAWYLLADISDPERVADLIASWPAGLLSQSQREELMANLNGQGLQAMFCLQQLSQLRPRTEVGND